ncbi:hypothetical protein [Spirosoma radiotolerans]|uniref:O-antigen polysaccharide polymerase Wzy n=1 Tax=Spirosoma radiotolerans TaxID=1379870 RepID=A0A0E3ZYZ6_9BACT|nr:hypothetical protein [Spirosoma radiotolerans]AKD57245.1 hypothetical protein SD10_22470 [Spirosoma radiotolerans]
MTPKIPDAYERPMAYPEQEQFAPEATEKFVFIVVRWSWITLIIASVLQCILFQVTANWVAVICVLIAWAVTTKVFLRSSVLLNYPLSTILVLGFASTQFYFPLLFTLIESKPIIFNLERPYDVFLHSMASLFVIVLAHIFYQLVFKKTINRTHSVLNKVGFFNPPTSLQLWLMGLMGVAATFYSYIYTPVGWSPTGAASDKFIQALIPFSYAPYFIPVGKLYGSKETITKRTTIYLLVFTIFLFIVSIARNNRTGFIVGFTSISFAYGLGLLIDYFKPRFFTLKNVFIGAISLWIITGPVADVSTAMVMVRDDRHNITYTELLERTFINFFDKEGIRLFRLMGTDIAENRFWDEYYMDNIFLARFSNLKYNDLSLIMASKVSNPDSDMLNYTIDHFFAILPLPFLQTLGINVDKGFVSSGSFGDYFHYKVTGNPWAIGGFRTGHLSGVSMSAFGWWYLAILGIGIIPVFLLYDKFSIRKLTRFSTKKSTPITFSLCGLLVLTDIFRFLTIESVEGIGTFLLRGWIQIILLYILFYHSTRLLDKLIKGISGQTIKKLRNVQSEKYMLPVYHKVIKLRDN